MEIKFEKCTVAEDCDRAVGPFELFAELQGKLDDVLRSLLFCHFS